jgi:peroxiredoxin
MIKRGWSIIILAALAMFLLATCYPVFNSPGVSAQSCTAADNVQLMYFHRSERCPSCNNAEQYTRDTLDKYFTDQVNAGKLSIQSIDYQKDKAMAEKYNVKMQGLKLLITRNGQQTVKDVPEVWAYVKDRDAYMNFLKNTLDKELCT